MTLLLTGLASSLLLLPRVCRTSSHCLVVCDGRSLEEVRHQRAFVLLSWPICAHSHWWVSVCVRGGHANPLSAAAIPLRVLSSQLAQALQAQVCLGPLPLIEWRSMCVHAAGHHVSLRDWCTGSYGLQSCRWTVVGVWLSTSPLVPSTCVQGFAMSLHLLYAAGMASGSRLAQALQQQPS